MEFKKWMMLNEGMMKLPMEFIKPIIDHYFNSSADSVVDKKINLDLSKSGFKFKGNYKVYLMCFSKTRDAETRDDGNTYVVLGSYYPKSMTAKYEDVRKVRKFVPKSDLAISATASNLNSSLANVDIMISGDETAEKKEELRNKEIIINGIMSVNLSSSLTTPYVVEHEILHFIQDILSFDVWLFSKSDKNWEFYKNQIVTVGGFKAKDVIKHAKEKNINNLGVFYDKSGRIQHSLRPTEFQPNLNSSLRILEEKYVKMMLGYLKYKTPNYEQFLKKLEDENFIKNYLNNSLSKFRFFQQRNILRFLPYLSGNDSSFPEKIKRYHLRQLHKNFMEPMSDDLIKIYVAEYKKIAKEDNYWWLFPQ